MFFSFLGGTLLGGMFFGGLYYSTRKLPELKRPGLFMLLSIAIRMTILLGGLYYLFDGKILNLTIALVGVFLSKFLIVKSVQKEVI